MDFGITRVDLALENSNPLTTHIVLYWKYSVEKKKIKKENIDFICNTEYTKKMNVK